LGPSSIRLIDMFFKMGNSSAVTFFILPFSLSKYGVWFTREKTCLDEVAMVSVNEEGMLVLVFITQFFLSFCWSLADIRCSC
jgi:hypothetical protein